MDFRQYKDASNQDLLRQFQLSHDNSLLGVLLSRYTLLLFGVCIKYLKDEDKARDAVQQIFLKVIDELHKHEVEHFKAWLHAVAKNYCLMQLRKRNVFNAELKEDLVAAPEAEISAFLRQDTALEGLQAALLTLNSDQRLCVTLFYLQKKSYHDISLETGYSMLQVKSHIQNGKRNLRLKLQKDITDE